MQFAYSNRYTSLLQPAVSHAVIKNGRDMGRPIT